MSAPETAPPPPPSHFRRFLYGLAGAALLGVGVATALLAAARVGEVRARGERLAGVTLSALADLLGRTGTAPGAAPATSAASTSRRRYCPYRQYRRSRRAARSSVSCRSRRRRSGRGWESIGGLSSSPGWPRCCSSLSSPCRSSGAAPCSRRPPRFSSSPP